MDDITQHPRYKDARRYACQVRGFYTHALVYVLVNAGLLGPRWEERKIREYLSRRP